MRSSFRLRLVLSYTAAFSALLLLFTLFIAAWIRQAEFRYFDEQLAIQVGTLYALVPGDPLPGLRHVENVLIYHHRHDDSIRPILLVYSEEEDRVFVTQNWPEELLPEDVSPRLAELSFDEESLANRASREAHIGWPNRMDRPPHIQMQRSTRMGRVPGPPPGGDQGPPPLPELRLHEEFRVMESWTIRKGGQEWRFLRAGVPGEISYIGIDLSPLLAKMRGLYVGLVVAFLMSVGLASFVAQLLAWRALEPVAKVTAETEKLTAKGLDMQIDASRYDREFSQLIESFNAMLIRLQESFARSERFAAAAAHQLRTPLMIMAAQLEEAAQDKELDSPGYELVGGLMEEVERLNRIVDQFLLFSRAEAGHLILRRETVVLSKEVQRLVEDLQIVAPDVLITSRIQDNVGLNGDPALLATAIFNVLSNAEYYCDDQRRIVVELVADEKAATLLISNTGAPISAEDGERIFDQFFRRESTRKSHREGLGLGLPLARQIARAHGGDLRLVKSDGMLNCFEFSLPRTRPS